MLRKSLDRGIPKWRRGRVMLVVILQCECVFGTYQVIEIRYGLIGYEIRRLREEHVLREVDRRPESGMRRRNQILAVGELIVQHSESNRADVVLCRSDHRIYGREEIVIGDGSQRCRAAIVGQPERYRCARSSNLQIGNVSVLVAYKTKKLVLDERSAECSARYVSV